MDLGPQFDEVIEWDDDEFYNKLTRDLGPEIEGQEWGVLPKFAFRAMSEEEYQGGVRRGFFRSDERNNWRAQQRRDGNPNWRSMPVEGTVAGVEAEPGYIQPGTVGRIVKFDTSGHSGWEIHPDVEEGDYVRTMGKIPADSIAAVSRPIRRKQ